MLTVHENLACVQAGAFLAVLTLELVWPQFVNALLGYTKELAVRQVGPHLSNKQQGREVVSMVAAANKASQQRVVASHQHCLSCLQRTHENSHPD